MSQLTGIALALSGGGAPAVGLSMGFGLAWDLFLLSHSLNDIEHFSGVSAGAIPSAYWASGASPVEIVRAQLGYQASLRPIGPDDVLATNWREILPALERLPKVLVALLRRAVGSEAGDSSRGPVFRDLLPSSIFVSDRIGAVLRQNLGARCGDQFDRLSRRLSIRIFDARTGRGVLCGHGGDLSVPVSQAVLGSMAHPVLYGTLRMRAGGKEVLALDGGSAEATFELRSFGAKEVVIILDATWQARAKGERIDLLEAAQLALENRLHLQNREEMTAFVNRNRQTHVLYFGLGSELRDESLASYQQAQAALKHGFELTRDRLAAELDYLDMIFRPRGVTLLPEIGEVRFEEAVSGGAAFKEALRRRHGLDPAGEAKSR